MLFLSFLNNKQKKLNLDELYMQESFLIAIFPEKLNLWSFILYYHLKSINIQNPSK